MQGWLSSWKVWVAIALTALALLLTFPRRSAQSGFLISALEQVDVAVRG